jgi:hypothetical protein
MKQHKRLSIFFVAALSLLIVMSGCKKMLGLEKQTNWEFEPHVLDPHINKSAWQYLKERATGALNPKDTIFKRMYEAILYAGIDSNEYAKPERTFIFLHNDAVKRISSNKLTTDCYWGYYKTPANKTANAWTDYPKEDVKNWLLYLIGEGQYSFENLGPNNDTVQTIMPLNVNPSNPESIMLLKINNDQNSRLRVNDYIGTIKYTEARTAGILSTNGPIHVVDRVVENRLQ